MPGKINGKNGTSTKECISNYKTMCSRNDFYFFVNWKRAQEVRLDFFSLLLGVWNCLLAVTTIFASWRLIRTWMWTKVSCENVFVACVFKLDQCGWECERKRQREIGWYFGCCHVDQMELLSVARKMSMHSSCHHSYNNFISFDAYTNWNADFKISILLFRLSSLVFFMPTDGKLGNVPQSDLYFFLSFRIFFLLLIWREIALFLLFCHFVSAHLSSFLCCVAWYEFWLVL